MRRSRRPGSACSGCDRINARRALSTFQETTHRQSRRDRLPHHSHCARNGRVDGCGLFGGRRRRAPRQGCRRGGPARSGPRPRQLSQHRSADRSRARDRRRGGASWLWLPVGERGLRQRVRGRGPDLRWADRRHDRCNGIEVRRQGADGEGRRAARSGLSRRSPGRGDAGQGRREDRLSGSREGVGRRRRARHAHRQCGGRTVGGDHQRQARGQGGVRR